MKKVDIENLWQLYVTKTMRVVLTVDSVQYIESKRVFYGAVGITLMTVRDVIGSNDMSEEDGIALLRDMESQVLRFFEQAVKETKQDKTLVPRFRGNAIQKGSAWAWEAVITIGSSEGIDIQSKQTFISKDAALVDMKDYSVKMLEEICKTLGGPVPSEFIDLIDGVVKSGKEFKK
jgi:hypothetical protein